MHRALTNVSTRAYKSTAVKVTSLGYQTDLALLRLGGAQVEDRGNHLIIRSQHNLGHWWGNFLLLSQVPGPEASQPWLDHFTAAFPGAQHVALGSTGRTAPLPT